jgi:hypothetical protein
VLSQSWFAYFELLPRGAFLLLNSWLGLLLHPSSFQSYLGKVRLVLSGTAASPSMGTPPTARPPRVGVIAGTALEVPYLAEYAWNYRAALSPPRSFDPVQAQQHQPHQPPPPHQQLVYSQQHRRDRGAMGDGRGSNYLKLPRRP